MLAIVENALEPMSPQLSIVTVLSPVIPRNAPCAVLPQASIVSVSMPVQPLKIPVPRSPLQFKVISFKDAQLLNACFPMEPQAAIPITVSDAFCPASINACSPISWQAPTSIDRLEAFLPTW